MFFFVGAFRANGQYIEAVISSSHLEVSQVDLAPLLEVQTPRIRRFEVSAAEFEHVIIWMKTDYILLHVLFEIDGSHFCVVGGKVPFQSFLFIWKVAL